MKYILPFLLCSFFALKSFSQNNTETVPPPPPPVEDSSKSSSLDFTFSKVEVEAQFPGGIKAWTLYLRNNLNPDVPVNNKAPKGTYTVIVRFIVKKDGSIQNVAAETKKGYGMEAEVIRIIKNGPKWLPAMQNNRPVNAYRRQPITFVVD